MARLIFKTKENFLDYMLKFSGTGRMMLLDVIEDDSLVLRPLVTSRGVDTAEIYFIDHSDKADIKAQFEGDKFTVWRVVWREEEAERR